MDLAFVNDIVDEIFGRSGENEAGQAVDGH
jgi:hypothetical protein